MQFHHITPDPELAPGEIKVVARILEVHQPGEQLLPAERLTDAQRDNHAFVIAPVADAVNAGYRSHHQNIPPRQQRVHGGEPQPLDLFIHAAVLLNEGVGARDVSLGLVKVEVADEVFDGVVGKEALELRVELGRQGLVVGQNQGGSPQLGHHIGHGEGLARPGDPQKHLIALPPLQPRDKLDDRCRLITGRLVLGFELKEAIGHDPDKVTAAPGRQKPRNAQLRGMSGILKHPTA